MDPNEFIFFSSKVDYTSGRAMQFILLYKDVYGLEMFNIEEKSIYNENTKVVKGGFISNERFGYFEFKCMRKNGRFFSMMSLTRLCKKISEIQVLN